MKRLPGETRVNFKHPIKLIISYDSTMDNESYSEVISFEDIEDVSMGGIISKLNKTHRYYSIIRDIKQINK